MNASLRPGSKQDTRTINEPGLVLTDGAAPPPQPEGLQNHPKAQSRSAAAGVGARGGLQRQRSPRLAEIPEEFVTLHQLEIVPTGPDPRRHPRFLAMHGGFRQRRGRRRPRSQPYAVPVSVQPQSQKSSAMGAVIPTHSDIRRPQLQPSLASRVQSRLVTSTGVMNGGSHTNQDQPRTQPPYQPISGSQYPPRQSQVEDTNVYISPDGGCVYQSPHMVGLDPSPGRLNGVAYGRPTESDTQHPRYAESNELSSDAGMREK